MMPTFYYLTYIVYKTPEKGQHRSQTPILTTQVQITHNLHSRSHINQLFSYCNSVFKCYIKSVQLPQWFYSLQQCMTDGHHVVSRSNRQVFFFFLQN